MFLIKRPGWEIKRITHVDGPPCDGGKAHSTRGRILSGRRSTFSGYLTSGILSDRRSTFSDISHPEFCPADVPPSSDISHPEFCPANVQPSPDISHSKFCPADVPPFSSSLKCFLEVPKISFSINFVVIFFSACNFNNFHDFKMF